MQSEISQHNFSRLPLLSKATMAYFQGTYLGVTRSYDSYKIALYALHNFYVEIWYLKNNGQLKNIKSFKNYTKLDPFLTNIDITSINNLLA